MATGNLEPVYLIDLRSLDCALSVRVIGRYAPGVPGTHDYLAVEFVAEAGPISVRFDDVVFRSDLARWSACLDQAEQGRTATWRDDGRTVALRLAPVEEGLRVTLVDEPGSGAELCLPYYFEGDWVGEQRALLQAVEAAFPTESMSTSPGVWTWKRASD